MNFLTQRPLDEDPLFPPPIDLAPNPTRPQVLKVDSDDAGSGGGSSTPAMVSPQGVALPQNVHTVSTQGPHTTQTVATPEGAAQYEKAKAAQQAEIDAHQTQHNLEAPLRDATAITADQQQVLAQKAELQKRLAASEFNSQLGKLTEVEDRRRKDLEANTKVTGYWEDKSVPAKIAAALMVGLNQYAMSGRGMGGGNKAYEIFQNAEAADRQKKLDKYTRSKEFLELAQTDKVKARAAYDAHVKDIDTLQIAAANSLEKNLATLTAKSKIPGADAAFQEWKAGKDEANAAKNQAVQQHLATQVNSGQTTVTNTHNDNGGKTPPNGPKPIYSADGKTTLGTVSDEVTARKLQDKVAAYQKVRDLTTRLSNSDVQAPLGSKEREQVDTDLKALATAQAILNNNEGKPSDADLKNAQGEVGSTTGMGTKAWLADKLDMPGLDPRTKWRIINDRAKEKLDADLGSHLGQTQIPDASSKAERPGTGARPPSTAAAPTPKASLESDVHALRRFLASDEAKEHPEAAEKARRTLVQLAEKHGKRK